MSDLQPQTILNPTILNIAKNVLQQEMDAIRLLTEGLGDPFIKAVERLSLLSHQKTGRVVVSGMGKSGIIGMKIAASLASTGTPAQFVHPAEAAHGDLGMITKKDVILALSNSGETAELAALMAYARQQQIDIISITSNERSTLAQISSIALIIPNVPEAGEIGLAPTTSTTLCLALGDALTIALMQLVHFTPEDFKLFHPGGALGVQLVEIHEIMHRKDEIPLCRPDDLVKEAILVMTSHHFGCVGIVNDKQKLVGIITDGDLRRHIQDDKLMENKVSSIMTHHPKTLSANILASQALKKMNEMKITSLFVVDEIQRPIGIVHIHDLQKNGR